MAQLNNHLKSLLLSYRVVFHKMYFFSEIESPISVAKWNWTQTADKNRGGGVKKKIFIFFLRNKGSHWGVQKKKGHLIQQGMMGKH